VILYNSQLDEIIQVLNLHSCRQTLVRDISGGELKRLSIAIELITNPPIMFFDEPTSGLDSVASYQVMCYLQQQAHQGRIVVALLLGVVYWQIGNDANKVISNVSCLFFIILFVFCGNAMPSILLCLQDSPVFIREYYNGCYSLRAYFISKVLADLPLQFTCPTLFVAISFFLTGQPPEFNRFIMVWSICVLTAFIGHFIGVICGTLFELPVAMFVVPAMTIPFLLFSGFFIRMSELSWFLRPICNVSYFRYIFEGLMRSIYGYNRGELPCSTDFCLFNSSEKFLKGFDCQIYH